MHAPRLGWPERQILNVTSLLGVLLLAACEAEAPPTAAAPPPTVEAAPVTVGDVPVIYDFAGTVKAVRRVDIVPRVSGEIMKRPFVEGAVVKEDEVLYQIDVRPYQAQLDNSSALVKRAKSDVGFWTAEVERYNQAAETGAVSVEQVEEARTKLADASAQVEKNQADVRSAELDVEYSTIKAPLTGRILQSSLYVGSVATAYESNLTSVLQLDPAHVIFSVSRNKVEEIQELMNQGIAGADPYKDFVVQVFNAGGSPFKYEGKIDFLSFLIDPTTDTMTVRAAFQNPIDQKGETLLVPGQYVPVKLTVGARKDQLLIPGPAVMETEAGISVYVIDKDGKVDRRKIETAGLHDQGWVVTKGLKEGESVVTAGQLKLRPGATAQIAKPDSKS